MRSWSWWVPLVVAALLTIPGAAFAQGHRVRVNIDSTPQGATVRLDSATASPLGNTPLHAVRVPVGSHTLYLTLDGYIPLQLPVTVQRAAQRITGAMQQAGSIYVSADVDGAQIFLDGNPVGTTPGRINNVTPGQHIVEIRQSGMEPFRDTVSVAGGAVASVNATLRPPPPQAPATGTVRVIVTNPNGPVPGDLQVTFDGTPMIGQPPSADAQPGTHIVQVSAGGFTSQRREVTITAGQTVALAMDLVAVQVAPTGGSVRVLVPTAGARVFLDGEPMNGSPPVRNDVQPGTHSVRVTAEGHQTVTREITVTAGQATVVEIPELPAVANVGHIAVRTATPGAQVFIDGRNVGPSPYVRDDMPAGTYNIVVRADGMDDASTSCTVGINQPCEVNAQLHVAVVPATIHIAIAPRSSSARGNPPNASVFLDDRNIGPLDGPRDIPNVPPGQHTIRVSAPGFADFTEVPVLQPGEQHQTIAVLRRERRGPTGQELYARRATMSTFGASPLAQGDLALDVLLSYGSYPFEVRATTGLVGYGALGIDAGFAIRTMGYYWELELRGRAGYRLLDGRIGVAGELRAFAGLGLSGQGNYGMAGFAIASLQSIADTNEDDDPDDEQLARERANQLGSFSLSIRFGFEAMNDGLNGMTQSHLTGSGDRRTNFSACGSVNGGDCQLSLMTDTMGNTLVVAGRQGVARAMLGASIEFGLGRHANIVVGVERVLADPNNIGAQRAVYQSFWQSVLGNGTGNADSLTYLHAGLTYKY